MSFEEVPEFKDDIEKEQANRYWRVFNDPDYWKSQGVDIDEWKSKTYQSSYHEGPDKQAYIDRLWAKQEHPTSSLDLTNVQPQRESSRSTSRARSTTRIEKKDIKFDIPDVPKAVSIEMYKNEFDPAPREAGRDRQPAPKINFAKKQPKSAKEAVQKESGFYQNVFEKPSQPWSYQLNQESDVYPVYYRNTRKNQPYRRPVWKKPARKTFGKKGFKFYWWTK